MKFTDVFIRRPVLASVVSLLILVLGLRSITALEVRQYPETKNTVVTVTTSYPGASSELIKGFITTPLQQAIAEADGIDYLFSRSLQSRSVIEAHMVLNYDPNAAVAEIQAKVASQRNVLPAEAEDPVIEATVGGRTSLMYLVFYGGEMSPSETTDYLLRVVQPRLQALQGVASADLFGGKTFAMRIWLDPDRMAALGVSAEDVRQVLVENNYLAAVGSTKGRYVAIDLSADTDISDVDAFRDLVVRTGDDTLVRLQDIADVELGAENYDSVSWFNGQPSVVIAIDPAPGANPLTVSRRVRAAMEDIRRQLPAGLEGRVSFDASRFIEDSIDEVFRTLAEAVLIVLAVIFLSLGSIRAALIPAVAVPLSLIGGAFVMLLLGFSINLLTLLAMVLAIGLVVDDAIIVVENVHRHIEEGRSRFEAAIIGAREIGLPIIAMTTTLIAVYAPIGFMGGLVGTLFTEFAFTLAGAVLISGIVALTLSPMLSAKALTRYGEPGRFERRVEQFFQWLADRYRRALHASLDTVAVTIVFAMIVLGSIVWMFMNVPEELAPVEDQGILFTQARGPQTATPEYNEAYARRMVELFQTVPEYEDSFLFLGLGGDNSTVFGGFKMAPAGERERTQMEVQPELQQAVARNAGLQIAVFPRPDLPGSAGGLPVQFVVTSAAGYERLDGVVDGLIGEAMQSGLFAFLRKSIEFSRPRITLHIDRDRAGIMGISMQDIGRTLSTMVGEGYVNRFNLEGRSYRVIPQVSREFRLDASMLEDYYVPAASGEMVPLSAFVTFSTTVEPAERTQFQQLNSVAVEGSMAPGVALGDALSFLEERAAASFPIDFSWDYAGEARQYRQQSSALVITFFVSLLVIYLVLAAQFESWRDPFIILISVPMSVAGALIFMSLGLATINIYTQVGLITLIGIVSKNGILVVEFANQLRRREGLDKRAAVEEAAAVRLRPILMTTAAMIFAMIPLLTASGAGAVSRFNIGLVIASGLGIGTLFTLFVVPAFYLLLSGEMREEPPAVEAHAGASSPEPA
ncbi:MAG: efflux RND transporter permease subunit [Gammaproteobacteria bacterium]